MAQVWSSNTAHGTSNVQLSVGLRVIQQTPTSVTCDVGLRGINATSITAIGVPIAHTVILAGQTAPFNKMACTYKLPGQAQPANVGQYYYYDKELTLPAGNGSTYNYSETFSLGTVTFSHPSPTSPLTVTWTRVTTSYAAYMGTQAVGMGTARTPNLDLVIPSVGTPTGVINNITPSITGVNISYTRTSWGVNSIGIGTHKLVIKKGASTIREEVLSPVSGTYTYSGLQSNTDYTCTYQIINAQGITFETTESFKTLAEPKMPPVFVTTGLSNGIAGVAYNAAVRVTGDSPISYNVSGLPDGINFSSNINGVNLAGTPVNAGTYTVAITATNSEDSVTKEFLLKISAAPTPVEFGQLDYSFDNGTFWTPYNHARVFENKKYTVLARDKMGNISLPYDVDVNNYFKREYDYPVINAVRNQETVDQWCRGAVQLSYPQFPSQNLCKFDEIQEGEDAYYKIERLANGNIKVTVKQEWFHGSGIPLFRIDNLWSANWLSTAFCLENTNMVDTQTKIRWFIPPNGTWNSGIPVQTIVTTGKQWMYQSTSAPGWQYATITNDVPGTWWEFSSIQVANENGSADWHLALRNPSPGYQPYFIKVFKSENREGPYAWVGQAPSVNGETIYPPQDRDYVLYYRLQDSWGNIGPITPVRIRMDNTIPSNLNLAVVARSRAIKATVTAADSLSGIEGYSVSINNGTTWTPIQIGNIFPFYRLASGTYIVKARAYDKAGNYVESSGQTHTI